ncbi:MAG: pyridoxal phosphate-dependent aminotransferase [Candidatus Thermoplasmatota archaeon]|nr:pyridoxal phosphate-dependent aminotransferase [Candidatus Thermoplasmatota archaeon]
MRVSQRVKRVELSGIRKMFEMAGEDSVMLGLGEPDFQPPEHIKDAFKKAIDDGHNKYGSTLGLPELRDAIAQRLRKWRDDVAKDNVFVTVSATEGLMTACQGLFEEGHEVLVPDPGFVLYESHIRLAGATPVKYPLTQENNFAPSQEELQELIGPNTRGIIVNTPSNPTGSVFNENTVNMISDLSNDNGLVLLSDEVYDSMTYGKPHVSFLGRLEEHVYVNSFSKIYAMTGWRLGYIATSNELVKELSKMHYYTVACPPTPTQYAALAALTGPQDEVERMRQEFQKRRDVIVSELDTIPGFNCLKPEGAFYAFPKFSFHLTSQEMAMEILKGGVISTPGSAFGKMGEGHIRFSYANSLDNVKKGMDRLRVVAENLEKASGEK